MGAMRGALAATAAMAVLAVGCATSSGGDAGVPGDGSVVTAVTQATLESNATVGALSGDTAAYDTSWCHPAIADLLAAGLDAVNDGVGSEMTGQPIYLVDACFWSDASIFLGRQPAGDNLDHHRTEDEMIGPWKELPGLGEQALRSVDVGWVFWIRDEHEYAIGTTGDYCYKHADCKAELVDAAKLIDQHLTGG
jgi:hypothetical protein